MILEEKTVINPEDHLDSAFQQADLDLRSMKFDVAVAVPIQFSTFEIGPDRKSYWLVWGPVADDLNCGKPSKLHVHVSGFGGKRFLPQGLSNVELKVCAARAIPKLIEKLKSRDECLERDTYATAQHLLKWLKREVR